MMVSSSCTSHSSLAEVVQTFSIKSGGFKLYLGSNILDLIFTNDEDSVSNVDVIFAGSWCYFFYC